MNIFLFDSNFFFFSVEIFLSISFFILFIFSTIYASSFFYNKPLIGRLILKLFVICSFLAIFLIIKNFWFIGNLTTSFFIFDFINILSKIVVILTAITCVLISDNFLVNQKIIYFEYSLILFMSVIAMLLLISSYNILSFFLALELQSFCFYILASYKKDSVYSTEAGLKYFLLGAFSSAILLFGGSLIYGFVGTTEFQSLIIITSSNYYDKSIINFGIILIIIGFFFKLGAFPFHSWLPDVYEGSITSTSFFFAITSKIGLFVILCRFILSNSDNVIFCWQYLFLISGLLSIFWGSFVALKQEKIKRLLAYSSISHVGYLLLALTSVSIEGFYAFFFYLIIYTFAIISVWCVVINVQNSIKFHRSPNLGDLCAIFSFNKNLAVSFLLAIFSMAGVPPLAGFYAKILVFLSVINANYFIVVTIALMITIVSTFFYIRLIKTSFFEKVSNVNLFTSLTTVQSNILSINSFMLIFLFFNPLLIDILTYRLALNL